MNFPLIAPETSYPHRAEWLNPPVVLDGFDFSGLRGVLIPKSKDDVVPGWLGQLIADARACRGSMNPSLRGAYRAK